MAKRAGLETRRLAIGLAIIILFAGAFFIYFIGPRGLPATMTHFTPPSSVEEIPSNTTSPAIASNTSLGLRLNTTSSAIASNTSLGLQLELHVSTQSGALNVTVDEFNTLSTTNNVTAASPLRYPSAIINAYSGCGGAIIYQGWTSELGGPAIFAVFQGYYDENNYTTGQPLTLYNTTYALTGCPGYNITYFSFDPLSSHASAYYSESSLKPSFDTKGVSTIVRGYWTGGQDRGGPAVFHQFSPGEYTVIALDEWGKAIAFHLRF